jgi:hypothetical protein
MGEEDQALSVYSSVLKMHAALYSDISMHGTIQTRVLYMVTVFRTAGLVVMKLLVFEKGVLYSKPSFWWIKRGRGIQEIRHNIPSQCTQ